VLSKHGLCSRTEAASWIQAGRVQVDGRVVRDPEFPIVAGRHAVKVDGQPLDAPRHHYLMLNKPRGLVTTTRDEQGRDTVYSRLQDTGLPWLAPVGRLDKASEGLLLFSNDPAWAAGITGAEHGLVKTYHVQIDTVPDATLLRDLQEGTCVDDETLRAVSVALLRSGQRNSWIEVVLDEGRNRHIRRLLEAFDIGVLRLVRVAIGALRLGELPKGQWRLLDAGEVRALAAPGAAPANASGASPADG
jgi:23S rRNA pseudouridine2605 synthase